MRLCIVLLALLLQSYHTFSQKSSRNGYRIENSDTIRIFLVFAEMVNDPQDVGTGNPYYTQYDPNWIAGNLPLNKDTYFDPNLFSSSLSGYITKYFYQASFGNYFVLGDYFPELILVDYNSMAGYTIDVIDSILAKSDTSIISFHGYTIQSFSPDFDKWFDKIDGIAAVPGPSNKADILMIVWRINSKLAPKPDISNTGYFSYSDINVNLFGNYGFMNHSNFESRSGNAYTILRHEYTHGLIGPNSFHTQGGAGGRKTISIPGGYGILSSDASNSGAYNAYDRWRLGWKPANHQYYISARRADDYSEVNSDFINNQLFSGGVDTFVLRDFAKYGDAIRIKLPYLKADNNQVFDQYLWLENHQQLNGYIDFDEKMNKGIYAYIQIGKNDTSDFNSEQNNYIHLLNSMGNYDLKMELTDNSIDLTDGMENPLTGYSMSMQPGININEPDSIPIVFNGDTVGWNVHYEKILGKETLFPAKLKINGQLIPADSFNIETYPIFGSVYDGFAIGSKIGMGSNPPATPVLTYETPQSGAPNLNPRPHDNRTIHLNGISIEILEAIPNANGDGNDIKVRIRWNDWRVDNDIRWCGPIMLHDTLILGEGRTIVLDQGLTPTKPVNPITFNGEKIFADPTTMTLRSGSVMQLEKNACVVVKNNATLVMESGSELYLADSAQLIIDSTSTLFLQSDKITLDGNESTIIIRSGARLVVSDGTTFTFSGDGFVQLYGNTNINFSTGAKINLVGSGKTHRHLILYEDATLNLDSNEVYIREAKVIYHSGANITLSKSKATFISSTFESQSELYTSAFRGDSIYAFYMLNSTVKGFAKGLTLSNIDNTTSTDAIKILRTDFEENLEAITLNEVKRQLLVQQ